ncbi:MAG: hypothetical protein VX938_08925 [Myxococcota bacterium]|nr:hypothetical protein [Myxococcota bacterium]
MLGSISNPRPRVLLSTLVGLSLVIGGVGVAYGQSDGYTPRRVDLQTATAQLTAWTKAMGQREQDLDARYGYQGSPATLAAAFEKAGLKGKARERAERWGRKLYVVWGTARPFFVQHRERLEETRAVFEDQNHALQADLTWLGTQMESWEAASEHLAVCLDELLGLWVQRARAMGRAEALQRRLKANQTALARLGSGDTQSGLSALRGELEQVLGDVSAIRATEYYLTAALRTQSAIRLWRTIPTSASRTRYRISGLSLPEPSVAPPDLSASAGMLIGAALPAALAHSDLPTLQEDVSIAAQEQDDALDDLAENLRLLRFATSIQDLPEVQALLKSESALGERVASLDAAIAALTEASPPGERDKLRSELESSKKKHERTQRRLTAWKEDGAFEEWKLDTERGLFTQRARVKIARRSEARAIRALSETAEKLLQAERQSLRALVDSMRQHLLALREGLSRNQDVRQVTVVADEQVVWEAVRPDVEALDAARDQLAKEGAQLNAVLDSAASLRALVVSAALDAEAGRDDLGENVAPGPLTELGEPALNLFTRLKLTRGLTPEVRSELERRYQSQAEKSPTLRSALRELVITTCATALQRFRGEMPDTEESIAHPTKGVHLSRLVKRVEKVTRKSAAPLTRAANKRAKAMGETEVGYPDDPRERAAIRRAELVALLALPLARWSGELVRPTWQGIAGRARDLVRHHSRYRKRDGFALTRNGAFLEGTSLEVRITQRDGARGDDLIVSVGGIQAQPLSATRTDGPLPLRIERAEQLEETQAGGVMLRVSRQARKRR